MKILIAEDDLTSRRLLESALTKWGFDVTAVADGQSAWKAFQTENAPRITLMDWMLPELDGIEVCRRIREAETTASTYIILLTSRSKKQDIVHGLILVLILLFTPQGLVTGLIDAVRTRIALSRHA